MVTEKKASKKSTKKHARVDKALMTEEQMQSFHLHEDVKPFTTFRITRQTVYWTILLLFIAVTQLLILKTQLDIANLTEQLVP